MHLTIEPPNDGTLRVVMFFDIHFMYYDPAALRLAILVAESLQPIDVFILGGDAVDFQGIKGYPKPPERAAGFKYELYAARRALRILFDSVKANRKIYIQGNHERRLETYLMLKGGELYGLDVLRFPELMKLPEDVTWLEADVHPGRLTDRIAPEVHCGKVVIAHGDLVRGSTNTINVARSMFLKLLTNMIVGHWHRNDVYTQVDYLGMSHGVWVSGCLACPRPEWDLGRIWGQGIIAMDLMRDGLFDVYPIPFMATRDGRLVARTPFARLSVPLDWKPKDGPPPLEELWRGAGYNNGGGHSFTEL